MNKSSISAWLLDLRLSNGWTLEEMGENLARAIGRASPFKTGSVGNWESGERKPSEEVLQAAALLGGVDQLELEAMQRVDREGAAQAEARARATLRVLGIDAGNPKPSGWRSVELARA